MYEVRVLVHNANLAKVLCNLSLKRISVSANV
jgi:hypothetical protein